ncbi:MAG: hypothetical protein AAFY08_03415 [Planctomycetota bacterium]
MNDRDQPLNSRTYRLAEPQQLGSLLGRGLEVFGQPSPKHLVLGLEISKLPSELAMGRVGDEEEKRTDETHHDLRIWWTKTEA